MKTKLLPNTKQKPNLSVASWQETSGSLFKRRGAYGVQWFQRNPVTEQNMAIGWGVNETPNDCSG